MRSLARAALLASAALVVTALQPAAARAEDSNAPLVLAQYSDVYQSDAYVPANRVWFAWKAPAFVKPELDGRVFELTALSFLPFGAVWGPIVFLGQPFSLDWALPPLVYQSLGTLPLAFFWLPVVGWGVIAVSYLLGSWFGGQVAIANLNRPDVPVPY